MTIIAIKSVSSGLYLDGRRGESNPLMTKRPPRGDVYLNWTLEDLGNNIYAIRSVSSHLYLDGRNASDSDPLMTNRQPIGDNYLQWTYIILNIRFLIY